MSDQSAEATRVPQEPGIGQDVSRLAQEVLLVIVPNRPPKESDASPPE